jgi:DNA-binding PadR family transcriptional regulator
MIAEPAEIDLTPTSFIVLGLVNLSGEATPYDLKRAVAASVGHFWSPPHSQLYAEPARLARAGYLTERQEPAGRRRKIYALTDRGRAALEEWVAIPAPDMYVLRDLALLKLFFGANPGALAAAQLDVHRRRLTEYEALERQMAENAPYASARLALDLGLRHERETVRFWEEHLG